MRTLLLLPILAFLLLSVGCSAVQRPTAIIQSANLGEITADGLTLDLDLLVANPNAFSIPLTKTDYAVSVGGAKLLDGTADPKTTLPANGSVPIKLPLRIAWADLLKAEDAIVRSGGDVPFTLSGKLGVGGGIPLLSDQSVPLSYSGTIPLRQALRDPRTILNSPAARQLARRVLGGYLPS